MENATAGPASSAPRTDVVLLFVAAAVQVFLLVSVATPLPFLLVFAGLAAAAYLGRGQAVPKLFVLTVVAVGLMPHEGMWGQLLRPEAILPFAGVLLWSANRLSQPPSERQPRPAVDVAVLSLIGAALVGAGVGIAHGRPPAEIWSDLSLYLFFGLALIVARTEFPESLIRHFFGAIIGVTLVVSLTYLVTQFTHAGARRPATDQQHLLNLAIPIVLAFSLTARRAWHRVLGGALLAVMLGATYVTLTRALWVYIPLSMFMLWIMLIRHRHIPPPRMLTVAAVGLVIVLVVIQGGRASARRARSTAAKAVAGRAESFRTLSEDISLLARVDLGLQALNHWANSPIIGDGLGSFLHYRIVDPGPRHPLMDNSYLNTLWKLGLLGLLPLLALYALFLKRIWFVYRNSCDNFQTLCAAGTFVAFVVLVILGIESGILIIYRFNLLWAMLLGIFERWAQSIRARENRPAPASGQCAPNPAR